MTDTNTRDLTAWIGHNAVDRNGDKIGKIADLYFDDDTGRPEWLAVHTGLFGTKVSFVPLAASRAAGDELMVAYDKAMIKEAPKVEPEGALSPAEEEALYGHYGYGGTGRQTQPTANDRGQGQDTSGPSTDDAMTRSEEELRVDKRTREAGRARLRKWVETEDVQVTVPV